MKRGRILLRLTRLLARCLQWMSVRIEAWGGGDAVPASATAATDPVMARLAERFPGAPEQWLRAIADRLGVTAVVTGDATAAAVGQMSPDVEPAGPRRPPYFLSPGAHRHPPRPAWPARLTRLASRALRLIGSPRTASPRPAVATPRASAKRTPLAKASLPPAVSNRSPDVPAQTETLPRRAQVEARPDHPVIRPLRAKSGGASPQCASSVSTKATPAWLHWTGRRRVEPQFPTSADGQRAVSESLTSPARDAFPARDWWPALDTPERIEPDFPALAERQAAARFDPIGIAQAAARQTPPSPPIPAPEWPRLPPTDMAIPDAVASPANERAQRHEQAVGLWSA